MKRVRCAIYTRKSSEEGLDQDFNSLDAQREACEAYIKSQKHEGWVILPERYDDGGVSGGTLERPALRALLQAIDDGAVDQIIVYKIDRLTRSLGDFTKLIERLDAARASFVSVTQSFNTATSMGRLTLNVLLSFAQFEREVTAERIRDKFAASKKKGMWMGGPVPHGYRTMDRRLIIDEKEAEVIKAIYDLYLQVGTVQALKEKTDRAGWVTRRSITRAGDQRGGKPFTTGHLYRILTNPIYAGWVSHKGKTYEGEQEGIIDRSAWDQVQAKLANKAAKPRREAYENTSGLGRSCGSSVPSSPLIGKLFDETGDRLTPSHANKKGKRYRYYVSNRLIKRSGEPRETIGGWRLPASELEQTVSGIVIDWLSEENPAGAVVTTNQPHTRNAPADMQTICPDMEALQRSINAINNLRQKIDSSDNPISLIVPLLQRVTLGQDKITIEMDRAQVNDRLGLTSSHAKAEECEPLMIIAPFQHRKRGVESRLVLGNGITAKPDHVLITNIANAIEWLDRIKKGDTVREIASEQNRSIKQIQRQLELAFLSPRIIQRITEGNQPPELTSRSLLKAQIPVAWDEQHRMFGIQ